MIYQKTIRNLFCPIPYQPKKTQTMLKNVILFLSIALFLASCSQGLKPLKMPKQSYLVGLASPILLGFDETQVTLSDYFPNIAIIDSIAVPEGITMELSEDQSILTLIEYEAFQTLFPLLSNSLKNKNDPVVPKYKKFIECKIFW